MRTEKRITTTVKDVVKTRVVERVALFENFQLCRAKRKESLT